MRMKTYSGLGMSVVFIIVSVCLLAAASDPQRSFLDAEAILAGWESTYGSTRTMRVSYSSSLAEYQPPANNPDEPGPVRYVHVERVESGKRYHIRLSFAEDGFDRHENLMEHAFDGKNTQEYWASRKHGSIVSGLTGRNVEYKNDLKQYMLLGTVAAPPDLKDEYPNGIPEMVNVLRSGISKGRVTIRPELESVAGQLCHVVEVVVPGKYRGVALQIRKLFWMAHDKGMCLMKYQEYSDDTLDSEIEVERIAMADMKGTAIWYPQKAYKTIYDQEFGTAKRELMVKEFIPNFEVDENSFRFDFPAGTKVLDRILGLSYVVGGEGPNGEVSPVYVVEPAKKVEAGNEVTIDQMESAPAAGDDAGQSIENEKHREEKQIPIESGTEEDKILGVKTLSILGVVVLVFFGALCWRRRSTMA